MIEIEIGVQLQLELRDDEIRMLLGQESKTDLRNVVATDECFVVILGNGHAHFSSFLPHQLGEVSSFLAKSWEPETVLLYLVVPGIELNRKLTKAELSAVMPI